MLRAPQGGAGGDSAGIALIDLVFLAGAAALALVLAAPDYQRALMRGDAEEILQ